jgi:uncharacterized SAM-binding protein YcdF (DUF218 family)
VPRALSAGRRHPIGSTLAVVFLVALGGTIAVTTYATFRIWQRGEVDEASRAGTVDAIVVLGAAQYDGRPSPVFRARLDHAIALWRAGRAPLLLTTGGRQEGDRWSEAAAARDYAIRQGVPAAAIRMEDGGRSTFESLQAVDAILEEAGLGSAVFVSDRSHMLRVMRMARDLGIEAYGSPAPDSPTDATLARRVDATLHELGALAWYALVGRAASQADPRDT